MFGIRIPALLVAAVAAAGIGALTTAGAAHADAGPGAAGVRAATEEAPIRHRGFITFRTERYMLSDRAVVTATPTTILIRDDAATTKEGRRTSLYLQLGYALDPAAPGKLRIMSGIAIRGYDFATGGYDPGQAIQLGSGALALTSSQPSDGAHMWGHLNGLHERGIDLDVNGVPLDLPA